MVTRRAMLSSCAGNGRTLPQRHGGVRFPLPRPHSLHAQDSKHRAAPDPGVHDRIVPGLRGSRERAGGHDPAELYRAVTDPGPKRRWRRYASRSAAIGVFWNTSRPVSSPMLTETRIISRATARAGTTAG